MSSDVAREAARERWQAAERAYAEAARPYVGAWWVLQERVEPEPLTRAAIDKLTVLSGELAEAREDYYRLSSEE
jgi:hypothetical protein